MEDSPAPRTVRAELPSHEYRGLPQAEPYPTEEPANNNNNISIEHEGEEEMNIILQSNMYEDTPDVQPTNDSPTKEEKKEKKNSSLLLRAEEFLKAAPSLDREGSYGENKDQYYYHNHSGIVDEIQLSPEAERRQHIIEDATHFKKEVYEQNEKDKLEKEIQQTITGTLSSPNHQNNNNNNNTNTAGLLLELPPSLTLLYYVADSLVTVQQERREQFSLETEPPTKEEADQKPLYPTRYNLDCYYENTYYYQPEHVALNTTPSEELKKFLQRLSKVEAATRRRESVERVKAVEAATCATLYEKGMTRNEMEKQRLLLHKELKEQEALSQCTFHPYISESAQKIKGKGTKNFMYKCIEWEKEAAEKLAARYAKVEEEVAVRATMNERSRQIALRSTKERPLLWEPKHTEEEPPNPYTHTPLTSAAMERQLLNLRSVHHGDTSTLTQPNKVSTKEYLARVEEDIQRRQRTAELLQRKYDSLYGDGRQYEERTGQPLHAPNSWPTLLKDGKHIPYYALDPADQQVLRQQLKKNGCEFALIKLLRREAQEQRKAASNAVRQRAGGTGEDSNVSQESMLQEIVEAERAVSVRDLIDRLEKEDAQREQNKKKSEKKFYGDLTFTPTLSKRTNTIAKRKLGGKPIYERPAPANRNPNEKDAPALHVKTDATAVDRVALRNAQWLETRERRRDKKLSEKEKEELAGCTFAPSRKAAHEVLVDGGRRTVDVYHPADTKEKTPPQELSYYRRRKSSVYSPAQLDQLAAAADLRLMNELEMLRDSNARQGRTFMDPQFVDTVMEGKLRKAGDLRHRTSLSASTRDPYLALTRLGMREAPRLPTTSQSLSTRVSPIPYPSQSRSPSHVAWRLAEEEDNQEEEEEETMYEDPHIPHREGKEHSALVEDPWVVLDDETDRILARLDEERGF